MKQFHKIIFFGLAGPLFLLPNASIAGNSATNDGEEVKWLGDGYGPNWIENGNRVSAPAIPLDTANNPWTPVKPVPALPNQAKPVNPSNLAGSDSQSTVAP